jgi:hypothetical protein
MTPTQEFLYWYVQGQRFVSPGLSFAKTQRLFLPLNGAFDICIQAVNKQRPTIDANGYAVAVDQFPLSDYTGTPILAVKTLVDALNAELTFSAAWSGYRNIAWHNLSEGRVALGGGYLSSEDVTAGDDYMIQARLATASNTSFLYLPSARPLLLSATQPVIVGDETGATPANVLYHGLATIAEGESEARVDVTGITADAEVILSQKDTGAGTAQFVWSIDVDNEQIVISGPTAGVETWIVGWDVRSL